MKNVRQLVELLHIENDEVRELFENEYRDDLTSNDSYFRYYPNDDTYDMTEGATDKLNEWLVKEGYVIDSTDTYFHLLIRWDW